MTQIQSTADNEKLHPNALAHSGVSCGVHILFGVQQVPELIVKQVLEMRGQNDVRAKEAFIVFSDYEKSPDANIGGGALARYIREHNFGALWETEARRNPNSGNMIRVWVWNPSHYEIPEWGNILPSTNSAILRGPYGLASILDTDPRFMEARTRNMEALNSAKLKLAQESNKKNDEINPHARPL